MCLRSVGATVCAVTAALTAVIVPTNARESTASHEIVFRREFAPSEGVVKAPEKPLRQEVCLNGRWQFQPVAVPADWKRDTGTPPELPVPDPERWEATPLKVPSPWNVNTWGNGRDAGAGTHRPYTADSLYFPSYPAVWDRVEMGWLRRRFQVPNDWGSRRVFLHFEGVAGEVQVYVNGRLAGTHFDSFLPFTLDVTALAQREADNELLVGIRKSSLFDKTSADYPENQKRTYPNGSNMDNLVGIWNDVFLLGLPAVRVDEVFIKPYVDHDTLETDITLRNDTAMPQTVRVGGDVRPWVDLAGKDILSAPEPKWRLDSVALRLPAQSVTIPPGATTTVTLRETVGNRLRLWSPDTPNLYGVVLSVTQGATSLDSHYSRFGWRQFQIRGKDLLLNGRRIQLFGDFLHPFGPYIGSRRFVWAYYRMIKDMGGNATRPHGQVHPRHYLDLADEMGLCVLDEAAVFGSSINLNLKEPITWQRLERHVDGMVRRDRNHPSVFGWSPANEMFALFFRTNAADRETQYRRLQQLALRPRRLDPTRDWISVDGDEDLEGVLPVWSKHWGHGDPQPLLDREKPLMIGEHGGTYYAAPSLLAPINGERSFESYAGRNEALAIDLYRMVTQTARPRLAFFSPSELGWFGLEHLPLGYRTDLRPPGVADGISFGPYAEGRLGIQPERIPPYVMTVNPGLDPSLPLYKPLAMFEAMKAAIDPRGPQPSRWSARPEIRRRTHPAAANTVERVAFLGSQTGLLYRSLYRMGLPLAAEADADAAMLVIDGEDISDPDAARASALANAVSARGGTVWLILRDKGAAIPRLRGLLVHDLELTDRRATSLSRGVDDPLINGFGLEDLYFVEESSDPYIQKTGIAGPILRSARVLLSASDTDWNLWHRRGEAEKNSNVLIYERLKKPGGAALLDLPRGTGRLWISALNYLPATPTYRAFWRQLFQNSGVKLNAPPVTALVPTAREGESALWRYVTEEPAEGWQNPGFDDSAWQRGRAGFGTEVPNGSTMSAWRTSDIWLRHEFTVQTVPEAPMLQIHHDEDVEVYLNGVRIFVELGHLTDYKQVPLDASALRALKTGRNVLAVHCRQTAGGQYIDVGLLLEGTPSGTPGKQHDLLLDGPVK